MKRKLYNLFSSIPVVGGIFCALLVPEVSSKRAHRLMSSYAKEHPDEVITRRVFRKIVKK